MNPGARGALALTSVAAIALAGCGSANVDSTPTAAIPAGTADRFNTPATLQSYRYVVDIAATTDLVDMSQAPPGLDLEDAELHILIEGERLNPDREYTHAVTTFGYLSVERETIVIGTRLWSRQANNAWRERATVNGPEDFIGQDVALSPSVILGTDDPEYLQELTDRMATQPFVAEAVNGRQTHHWTLTQREIKWIQGDFNTVPGLLTPEAVTVDVWVDTETGVAVRVLVTAASTEDPNAFRLTMDLYDLNDDSIQIVEPAMAIGGP